MSTITDIIFSFIEELDPAEIRFTGSTKRETNYKEVTQRTKFYREYIKRQLPDNYEMIEDNNKTNNKTIKF